MARKYRVVNVYNRQLLSMEPYVSLRDAKSVVKIFRTITSQIERYDEKEREWVPYDESSSRNRSGSRSARPRSAGFVVLNTKTGDVLSELFKKRQPARDLAAIMYRQGLPTGVHQVMLYPDEQFDPKVRR